MHTAVTVFRRQKNKQSYKERFVADAGTVICKALRNILKYIILILLNISILWVPVAALRQQSQHKFKTIVHIHNRMKKYL